jgi:hypothetical protein
MVRLLSFNEMLKLNSFPEDTLDLLRENRKKALRYIANAIPTRMLHTIYSVVIDDLDREMGSGGDAPCISPPNLLNLSYCMSAQTSTPSKVMTQPIDLDVRKVKHYQQSRTNKHKIKFSRDPTHAAIRRMRIMHRTYHSYRDRVQKSLSCVSGLGITENMLKHEIPCFDCIMADERAPCRKHHSSDINKFEKQYEPGEGWCFDGGDVGVYSINGHRYAIVFVCIRSKEKVTYYCKDNSAAEFKKALEYLMFHVKTLAGGGGCRKVKLLYSDMFSTYRSFLGEDSIRALRDEFDIRLEQTPPYAHWLNGEAEKAIQTLKRGTRARLRALTGKFVNGKIIRTPHLYWTYAWEHTMQCDNALANMSLLNRWHHIVTSDQVYHGTEHSPQVHKHHPFGETGYTTVEKRHRNGSLADTKVLTLYLINGQMNPLQNKFVHQPEADILLFTDNATIKTSCKTTYPYITSDYIGHGPEIREVAPPIFPSPEPESEQDVEDPVHEPEFNPDVPPPPQLKPGLSPVNRSDSDQSSSDDDTPAEDNARDNSHEAPANFVRRYRKPKPGDTVAKINTDGTWSTFRVYKGKVKLPRLKSDDPEDNGQFIPQEFLTPFVELPGRPKSDIGVFDARPKRYGSHWRLIRLAQAATDRMLVLPSLQQLLTLNAGIKFPYAYEDRKGKIRSRSRYSKYCAAKTLPEYFDLEGTHQDYFHDLSKGNIIFNDRDLWALQYGRSANWRELSSGGDDSTAELHLLSLHTPWIDPQETIQLHGNLSSSNDLMHHHLYSKDPKFFQLSQKLHKQWLTDKSSAATLGMTPAQYYSARYQAESIINCDGMSTNHLHGNQTNPEIDEIKDLQFLSMNADQWSYNNQPARVIAKISTEDQASILRAVRKLDWNGLKDANKPGDNKYFDLRNHFHNSEHERLYNKIIGMLDNTIEWDRNRFNSIHVSHNSPPPSTTGHSLCFSLGNYSGGDLRVDDLSPPARKRFNTCGTLVKYNGKQKYSAIHAITPGSAPECYYFTIHHTVANVFPPCAEIDSIHMQLLMQMSIDPEDIEVEQAELVDLRKIKDPAERSRMMDAIIKEINGLIALGTFELVPCPKSHRPIDSRFVF